MITGSTGHLVDAQSRARRASLQAWPHGCRTVEEGAAVTCRIEHQASGHSARLCWCWIESCDAWACLPWETLVDHGLGSDLLVMEPKTIWTFHSREGSLQDQLKKQAHHSDVCSQDA